MASDHIPVFIPPAPGPVEDTPSISPDAPGPSSPDYPPIVDFQRLPDNLSLSPYRMPPVGQLGRDSNGRVIQYFRSEETALLVAHWVAYGASENFICAALNMRPGKLRQLYGAELDHGEELANMAVAGTAFNMATSGASEQMTKFWLKSRAKWKDGETGEQTSLFNIHIHE